MKHTQTFLPSELYVNIPVDGQYGGYIFDLPSTIYVDNYVAMESQGENERTVTVEECIARIKADVHHDS